ncbi:excalibur calcium-binding domain-containing protein [Nocardioides anomalus]|uniref:Excalibur calcium-binding domain-containing protein n=1 Tax=Nocardioides anomalus TaxID=2712223 RepID=A0A6G6WA70_9ACTN|nr:excalibur calcium-binding domain-containing protein [Nocardioides anomalus]QIG42043.1 excalibur calcium-binding domain-containing protein [Nocardioides anomalus]
MRYVVRLIALVLTAGGFTAVSLVTAGTVQAKDMDCGNFATQAAAQNYFLNHGGPNSDPDYLDADGDGIACESNPCPCSYSTGGGGGGGGTSTPAKKFHTIKLRVAKVSGNFKILGKVPTYRGKFQIQRRVPGGKFKFYTRTKSVNPGGKVKIQVKGSRNTCFRVSVPATNKYKLTTKEVGCIR